MNIDWITVSGIATGVAAIATAAAAIATAWMASMTKRSLQQAEKHHQDSYRPILVIAPPDDAIPMTLQGASNGKSVRMKSITRG